MADERFAEIVSLACHDLRTPLATVTGFAKTIISSAELDARSLEFLGMIDGAASELAELLDELGVLARIEAGTYEPVLVEADTREVVEGGDQRIGVSGTGATILTDVPALRRSLHGLAVAAVRHGGVPRVEWVVSGRELELTPVVRAATAAVAGEGLVDLGAIVGRRVIERLGGSLVLEDETLRVSL